MGGEDCSSGDGEAMKLFFQAQDTLRAGMEDVAEKLHREALARFEKSDRTHGLHAFLGRGQVAGILANRKEYAQSIAMFRNALSLYSGSRDPKDEPCIGIIRSMAMVLEESGDITAAIEAFQDVVGRLESVKGEQHPDTLRSIKELAQALGRAGRHEESERLHWKALKGHKSADTLPSRDALVSKSELALVLLEEGDAQTAERLFREVVVGRELQIGPDHPHTLQAKQNLAAAISARGDINAAVALFDDVLEAKVRVLGAEHRDTVLTRDNVISLLLRQRDYSCCEPYLREQVRVVKKVVPEGHEHAVTHMLNHGVCLLALKRPGEAGPVLADAVRYARANLGDDHRLTQNISRLLADLV